MVFYTNRFIREGTAGCVIFWFIFIRPEYRGDAGLLAHEKVHVAQFWRRPFIHGVLYRFSKRYRLAAEVEAYREQLKHYSDDRSDLFARFITDLYGLEISQDLALDLLKL